MILVCGGIADAVTELVCARLEACRYPYRLLDQARFPSGFTMHWSRKHDQPKGFVEGPDWHLDLEQISAVYARYLSVNGRVAPSGLAPEMQPGVYREAECSLTTLFEDLPCVVVNRTRGGLSNGSKPYQAQLIEACGLRSPETLITNDPEAALAFYHQHCGDIIYKSLSGVRSIVRRVSADQLKRMPLLPQCPTQFQRRIPGDDVRVHVVGDEVFATRIHSEATDYRYARHDGHDCEMSEERLHWATEEACIHLARQLDLVLAGIDLRITPEGEVFCFEVNPSPGFIFYEVATGQPISAALADLLHRAPAASGGARLQPQLAANHAFSA